MMAALGPRTRQLWQSIGNLHRFNTFGDLADMRSVLALCRLAPTTWSTYSTAMTKLVAFLDQQRIPLYNVTEHTLEAFVCWLAVQPKPIRGASAASTLSGIRSCLAEMGNVLTPSASTRAALQGYKRLTTEMHAPALQHAAWNPEWTLHAVARAQNFLQIAEQRLPLRPQDHDFLVAVAHVALAQLTFGRGHTTNAIVLEDVSVAQNAETGLFTLIVGLVTQKRPQDRLPLQTHVEEVAGAQQFDPRRFLCRFINARALHGAGPMTRLFLNHRSKLISLDAAVKILVAELNIHHHHGAKLTGHTVRVGAATAAFGIGVPMVTIAHWMAHKDVKSTMGYIRHGTPSTAAAVVFFGHLRPTLPSGQPHYALH